MKRLLHRYLLYSTLQMNDTPEGGKKVKTERSKVKAAHLSVFSSHIPFPPFWALYITKKRRTSVL